MFTGQTNLSELTKRNINGKISILGSARRQEFVVSEVLYLFTNAPNET